MASNREERFLMRQRGAGTHRIKDVDFGIAFPTIAEAPKAPKSHSKPGRTQTAQEPQPSPPDVQHTDGDDDDDDVGVSGTSPRHISVELGDASVIQVPRSQGTIPSASRIKKKPPENSKTTAPKSHSVNPPESLEAEIPDSSSDVPPNPLPGANDYEDDIIEPHPVTPTTQTKGIEEIPRSKPLDRLELRTISPSIQTEQDNRSVDDSSLTLDPTQGKRRRRRGGRMSFTKPHKQRTARTSNETTQSINQRQDSRSASPIESARRRAGLPSSRNQPSPEILSMPSRGRGRGRGRGRPSLNRPQQAQPTDLPRRRGRPSLQPAPSASPSHSPDYLPAARRRQRTPPIDNNNDDDDDNEDNDDEADSNRDAQRGPPVTVYRHTKIAQPSLDHTTATAPTFIRPSGVNAIDVLAQVSAELIANHKAALGQHTHSSQRTPQPTDTATATVTATNAELKRKRKAIDAFGAQLQDRCFQMAEAVDTHSALTTRLRLVQREKLALRSELLAVRRERSEVALRLDAVRAAHAAESDAALATAKREELLRDVELAVARGRSRRGGGVGEPDDDAAPNLEAGVRNLVERGVIGDTGGLLQRVKEFNSFLESAAARLEGR
ncbi:MAG: hypothetical protein M1825_005218 [Sarcosagium campestre]|nr:MAG: hypothetical protein M1825_005218 [Sarcosagium campestre]